jgi:hypothetical protein
MQELTDSIKRPNLRITGIEEREEVKAKGTCYIFNKIIKENFPNLEKVMPIQVQEYTFFSELMEPSPKLIIS